VDDRDSAVEAPKHVASRQKRWRGVNRQPSRRMDEDQAPAAGRSRLSVIAQSGGQPGEHQDAQLAVLAAAAFAALAPPQSEPGLARSG
jgi:hypothetical protein